MPELLEPLKLELPPLWVEPPVVEPAVVVTPPEPDINELAARLLDDAAKHLEAAGWIHGWGRRGRSTCIIGAMQEVLFVARGWRYDLGEEFTGDRFRGDPVARKAFDALRFTSTNRAIQWNDQLSSNTGASTVIKRLREGADLLRGVHDSAAWTG